MWKFIEQHCPLCGMESFALTYALKKYIQWHLLRWTGQIKKLNQLIRHFGYLSASQDKVH